MKSQIHCKETQCGFEFGAAKVDRLFDGDKKGWVVIGLKTPKEDLQIYVTKTGKVRVHGQDCEEWKPER